jgi:hypothetical protein
MTHVDEPVFDLQSEGRFTWQAFSPDDGRVSPSYFLRVKNREIYVGQRGMEGIHISLHHDGEAHITAPDHQTAEAWGFPDGSRRPSEWNTSAQFHHGWSRLLHVVHPEPELRHFNEAGLETVDNLIRLPVGVGMALHVCLLRYTGAPMNTRIEFDNAHHVATIDDGPDWRLEVMAILDPWSPPLRGWAEDKRGIPPGSHDRSAVKPDFNRESPSARLTKLVIMEDGSHWVYDLAANPPAG